VTARFATPGNFSVFIRANGWFFSALLLFLIAGAVYLLRFDHGDMVMFFSDNRSPAWDVFFKIVTRLGEEPAFIVILLLLLFVQYRSAISIPFLGIIVTILAFLFKELFSRPRPLLYYRELGLESALNLVSGMHTNAAANSFPSGHTMAGFALYAFLAFVLRPKQGTGLLLFSIAALVALSRVYLTQHFFEDIYLGAILGTAIAIAVYYLQFRIKPAPHPWLDRHLGARRQEAATVE